MKVMCFLRKKKKVGLVLGSGGARGLAHLGVIKTLEKHGIPIDLIVGASSGALVGGFYAAKGEIQAMEKMIEGVTYKDLAEVLVDPSWGGGLIKGKKTEEFLRRFLGKMRVEETKIPFATVATDVKTAEGVVFENGDMTTAIRASISIPLIYEPVYYEGRTLVDGGVSYPVPVEIARKMGADVVIAVNLDSVYFGKVEKTGGKLPSSVEVLKNSYFALRYNLSKKEVRQAEVVIEPEMEYISDLDFVQGKKAVEAGQEATERLIRKIKKLV